MSNPTPPSSYSSTSKGGKRIAPTPNGRPQIQQGGSQGASRVVQPGTGIGGARVITPGTGVGVGVAGTGVAGAKRTQNSILVNMCQKGNHIIAHIRNVPWEYGDIVPDYQVGATTGLLFISLKYHLLHPEYIHTRIEIIGSSYSLRLLLVMCDVENHQAAIKELTKICVIHGYTMIVAWSAQEAGRYLETFKSFETKPPDLIRERVENDYMSHLEAALTSITGVNKTDVTTLASTYGSFAEIIKANSDSLLQCPGMGDKKVKRLRAAITGPFISGKKKKKKTT